MRHYGNDTQQEKKKTENAANISRCGATRTRRLRGDDDFHRVPLNHDGRAPHCHVQFQDATRAHLSASEPDKVDRIISFSF
jgi:hypothetical protein